MPLMALRLQSYGKSREKKKKNVFFFSFPRWSNLYKVTENRVQNKMNLFIFYAEME